MKIERVNKKLVNFTVDKSLAKEFDRIAKLSFINKSALVESWIREWVSGKTEAK